jgi:hypothetical protein
VANGNGGNGEDVVRCDIRPTPEQAAYLDQLIETGLHGKTRTEVARFLVIKGLETLVQQGILKLRTSGLGGSDG